MEKKAWFARMWTCVRSFNHQENLLDIAKELKTLGWSQRQVYDLFMEFLEDVAESGTDQQDDNVRDVLDVIYGWGSTKLFGKVLTEDE